MNGRKDGQRKNNIPPTSAVDKNMIVAWCVCKTNAEGDKCATCKAYSANLGSNSSTGCQSCEFGPLAGGTDVTITGELFENHTVKPIILIGVNAQLLSFWYTIGFYHILGGVCLCVVIMLVVVSCCCYRRRKSKGAEEPVPLDTSPQFIRYTFSSFYQGWACNTARSVLAPTTSFLSPTPTSNTASHKVAFCDRLDESDAKLIESSNFQKIPDSPTKDKVIPSVDLMELCLQVAEGMEYLSTLAVVHKDLACRNCW
ncbi:hypothetical protein DPMN_066808 [Dreissena polymorpha]|uniref:Serine-threonine/tyrosine-protein kinase catalytic domain-containing protein n=1 Tax=Dreissena polymorpha TaxID=45954 RepID=A0A9D4BT59_DREPO|nr:hypothetical protein DPMN_066808 [Dreissena polymorpha]